jgi:hypothetical protein
MAWRWRRSVYALAFSPVSYAVMRDTENANLLFLSNWRFEEASADFFGLPWLLFFAFHIPSCCGVQKRVPIWWLVFVCKLQPFPRCAFSGRVMPLAGEGSALATSGERIDLVLRQMTASTPSGASRTRVMRILRCLLSCFSKPAHKLSRLWRGRPTAGSRSKKLGRSSPGRGVSRVLVLLLLGIRRGEWST